MAESQRPARARRCATVVPRSRMRKLPAADFAGRRRSCTRRLEPGGKSRATVPRQMQWCPSVRRTIHEPMTRDVIARVEAVEVHAHSRELFAPVIRERAQSLIARASCALFGQRSCEFITAGKAGRMGFHERAEPSPIRPGMIIDQSEGKGFRSTEWQAPGHDCPRLLGGRKSTRL